MVNDAINAVRKVYKDELANYELINQTILSGDSAVQQFYDDDVIFLTGGSGFLGKHLVEKLFRSCKIKKIYLLLRSQKNTSGLQRVKKILDDQLYEYLFKTQPDFQTKIIPVDGDITKKHLGIDEKQWSELVNEVNIIFHSAATINFTEPLKVAALTNVRGTQEVLNLARNCKNLRSMVHVSTAYVQSTIQTVKQTILEQFYKSPLSPECLLQLVEELDNERLDALTPQLLQNWPNTYAFTKSIAEELVRESGDGLPICIVRPAIVMSAVREPVGWIDKKTALNGPVGLVLGVALGALHVTYSDVNTVANMVPVDFVNNAVIIGARETAERHQNGKRDIKIYTVAGTRNQFTYKKMHTVLSEMRDAFVSPKVVWYPYILFTNSKLLFIVLSYLLHFVPGYLADGMLQLLGQKPKAIRLLSKAFKQCQIYNVYTSNDWHFDDQNLLKMYERQSTTDRIIFNCDISSVTVWNFLTTGGIGVRKYILKEDVMKSNELAVNKQFYLRLANIIFILGYIYVIWRFFSIVFGYAFGL